MVKVYQIQKQIEEEKKDETLKPYFSQIYKTTYDKNEIEDGLITSQFRMAESFHYKVGKDTEN